MNNQSIRSHTFWLGFTLALVAATAFASKAIFVKLAYRHTPDAELLLLYRMALAFPVFLCVFWWQYRKIRPARAEMVQAAALGILGYYASSVLDFHGLLYISASLERIILFLYPTFVLLISILYFRKKPIFWHWTGLVLAYLGIFLIYSQRQVMAAPNLFLGSLFVLAACLTYAIFLSGSQQMLKKWNSLLFTSFAMGVSCLAVFLHSSIKYSFFREAPFALPGGSFLQNGILLAVVSTIIPSFALSASIAKLDAVKTSIIGALGPIITILLATIFLKEDFSFFDGLGSLIVILGVFTITLKK